ncbi:MAG TPA: TetR/AcrR family transcriptional regulator [Kribbella sp.]|uniref:TetR/AcrR family transcriptional regulator n=1 Tax=Kribbella sp. TaxID=1871183 RepID=UPI002D76D97C|nr:TetR/AcrR family transcriptional regulator [Kribbella sp.]HET6298106.1 TetR/AcrR family transcriptional regulator [Kribbella sp.]
MGKIRDAERTKARILHAAADAVRRAGPSVSLDAIAQEAKVSKGGLMHHFQTREQLMLALVENLYTAFEASVKEALSKDDTAPGRLARAYIRASFAGIEPSEEASDQLLLAQLALQPAIRRYIEELESRWHKDLAEDGLHPRMALLISAATEGAGLGETEDGPDSDRLRQLERDLLTLTRAAPAIMAVLDIADPPRP